MVMSNGAWSEKGLYESESENDTSRADIIVTWESDWYKESGIVSVIVR